MTKIISRLVPVNDYSLLRQSGRPAFVLIRCRGGGSRTSDCPFCDLCRGPVCVQLLAGSVESTPDGAELRIMWHADSFGPHELALDPPTASTFAAEFLRSYAEVVAEPIDPPASSGGSVIKSGQHRSNCRPFVPSGLPRPCH